MNSLARQELGEFNEVWYKSSPRKMWKPLRLQAGISQSFAQWCESLQRRDFVWVENSNFALDFTSPSASTVQSREGCWLAFSEYAVELHDSLWAVMSRIEIRVPRSKWTSECEAIQYKASQQTVQILSVVHRGIHSSARCSAASLGDE